jgi:hypothetical protein
MLKRVFGFYDFVGCVVAFVVTRNTDIMENLHKHCFVCKNDSQDINKKWPDPNHYFSPI